MALPAAPAGPRLTRSTRIAVAAVLGLYVLVSGGVLAWLLATGGPPSSAGDLSRTDEREEAMSLGDQFVRRLGSYSPDMLDESGQMPDYRDQVREVITPKFAADFDEQVATAEQLVAQGGITRTTDVFATAVSSIDDDSARVLVAGAFTDSYSRERTGKNAEEGTETVRQEPLPFRFTVDLVLVDGDWLVDDFSRASDPEDGTQDGTGGPDE